jgi:hypothetical protein
MELGKLLLLLLLLGAEALVTLWCVAVILLCKHPSCSLCNRVCL